MILIAASSIQFLVRLPWGVGAVCCQRLLCFNRRVVTSDLWWGVKSLRSRLSAPFPLEVQLLGYSLFFSMTAQYDLIGKYHPSRYCWGSRVHTASDLSTAQYFASTMIIVGLSVVVTVIVLRYHHHDPDGGKMPKWVGLVPLWSYSFP